MSCPIGGQPEEKMVTQEQEMATTGEEVIAIDNSWGLLQLPGGQHQPNKDLTLTQNRLGLGRQSSIYSLTLDEFQHTLSENGKKFGSMNMDEFLASIWTAEENQNQTSDYTNDTSGVGSPENVLPFDPNGVCRQSSSLPRQGSLSLPAPLCRKTVDEVWSEIHTGQGQGHGQGIDVQGRGGNVQNPDSVNRQQPTFGEMTLEDFLIRAGVVREQQCAFPTMPAQQELIGFYQGGIESANSGAGFPSRPVAGIGAGGGGGVGVSYPLPGQVGVYGGRVGNGGGVDGMDMVGLRGRKRIIDGPMEKVVERRHRRMIKNRESAARSRARKQAYTVELEAELTQLKEKNKQLKQALAELENKKKQQCFEEMRTKAQNRAQKDKERLKMMRRNLSCPL